MIKHCGFRNKVWNGWTILVWAVVIALLLSGCGAKKPKVYRVGILHDGGSFDAITEGFKAEMTKLGYVEGENIIYDEQNANSDPAEEQRMAKKLVDDKVDLIFSFPTPVTFAARAAIQGTDVPLVFAYVGIEDNDLVQSVREPGGNITGVRYPGPELTARRLEILCEIMPEIENVWIGYDKNSPTNLPSLDLLRQTASALGVTLVEVPAATMDEIQADLAARAAADDPGMDAILLMPDGFNHAPAGLAIIAKFATEQKVPLGGSFPFTLEQGAVFGNANDLAQVGALAAPLADKILKGTQAGTIPVVTPDQILWINYKVAQELGLTVPEGLMKQAVEVMR